MGAVNSLSTEFVVKQKRQEGVRMGNQGHEWEKEVLIVAKELVRQTEVFRRRYGGEAWGKDSHVVKGIVNLMQGIQLGHITTGDAAAEIQTIDERLEADISATNDPALAALKRSEVEAEAKGLSHLARLLAWDASRAAAAGMSKEEWIMQVVAGHEGDERAQITCLKYILILWEQGPWPWRGNDRQMGRSINANARFGTTHDKPSSEPVRL